MKKVIIKSTKQSIPRFVYSSFSNQIGDSTALGRLILRDGKKSKI